MSPSGGRTGCSPGPRKPVRATRGCGRSSQAASGTASTPSRSSPTCWPKSPRARSARRGSSCRTCGKPRTPPSRRTADPACTVDRRTNTNELWRDVAPFPASLACPVHEHAGLGLGEQRPLLHEDVHRPLLMRFAGGQLVGQRRRPLPRQIKQHRRPRPAGQMGDTGEVIIDNCPIVVGHRHHRPGQNAKGILTKGCDVNAEGQSATAAVAADQPRPHLSKHGLE